LCLGRRAVIASEGQATQAAIANRWASSQYRVAAWQIALNLAALVGVFFTVYYARRAWKAAQVSASAATDAIAAEHRPWLYPIVTLDSGLEWIEQGGIVAFRIDFKNKGRSPALHAQTTAVLSLDQMNPGDERLRVMESARAKFNKSNPFAQTIFPGIGTPYHPANGLLTNAEVDRYYAEIRTIRDQPVRREKVGFGGIAVHVVVTYISPFSKELHQTAEVLHLDFPDPATWVGPAHGNTPKDKLRLGPTFYGLHAT